MMFVFTTWKKYILSSLSARYIKIVNWEKENHPPIPSRGKLSVGHPNAAYIHGRCRSATRTTTRWSPVSGLASWINMTSHACTESVRNREVEMYRPESHKVPGRDPNMSGTSDEGELGYFFLEWTRILSRFQFTRHFWRRSFSLQRFIEFILLETNRNLINS